MNLAQRVNDHITAMRPQRICDQCIARAQNINVQLVGRGTMALGTTGEFERCKGVCRDCGRAKMVICRT